MPGEANTLALYYNADMFRAKGLDPDKPPKTWAELKSAVEKLTDPAKNVYGIGFSAIQSEEGTFQFLPFLQQSGGSLKDLASPDSVAALGLWADWVKAGQASRDVLVKRQFEMTSAFLGGASAMVISGPWELQRMDKDAKFEWRVAKLPVREGKNIEASALGGYVWGIPKGAKNRRPRLQGDRVHVRARSDEAGVERRPPAAGGEHLHREPVQPEGLRGVQVADGSRQGARPASAVAADLGGGAGRDPEAPSPARPRRPMRWRRRRAS